jgi:SAM-dependent methyltransferase
LDTFPEAMHPRDANEDPEVYYTGKYWNDLDCTNGMINRRISGDSAVNWWRHFASHTGRAFERALILNCGNGWVEREMFDGGLFKEAVGIDYSESLLSNAEVAAEGRPLQYSRMNINSEDLPTGPFDLVVNHAASHHVTRLDRLFRSICNLLPEDGWFISLDYVGPHRNQYAVDAWNEAWRLNQSLPEHVRQSMEYPLLPLWIEVDPTEAVHSELIVETLYRYFHVDEFVPLGGALAYPVLTHNEQLSDAVGSSERERWGQFVLERDANYLAEQPGSSLFAYFSAQPKKEALSNQESLNAWKAAEDLREAEAAENAGRYYEASMLNEVYWALAVQDKAARDFQRELQTIRSSFLYSHLTRMLESPLVRRVLQSRLVRLLRRRQSPSG